jgi:hypothetical protein
MAGRPLKRCRLQVEEATSVTTAPAASLPRTQARARVASVPASLWLAGLVAVSFAARIAAAAAHVAPRIFPDEYIYAALGRSLGDGSLTIRGQAASFPALLEPLLASPLWALAGDDIELGYRLTQGMHALAVSLTAVPVYLLARRLGLSARLGLGCAALTLLLPVLSFAPFVMADPIALPLVLGALAAGTAALDRPGRGTQTAFFVLAALATLGRIQYVVLVPAFLVAALVVSGGSVRRAARDYRLTLALLVLPAAAAIVAGPRRVLGYYDVVVDLAVDPAGIMRWLANDALLVAYAAGWVLVPGALVGLALALVRPATRVERAFAALAGSTALLILGEAAVYATNGSERFQERYLAALLPLVPLLFCLGARRISGGAARAIVALLAAGLLLAAAIVPLSGYAETGKQDSPTLWAVYELGERAGVGNGGLLIALLAALAAAVAAATAGRGPRGAAVALATTGAVLLALSAGAVRYDVTQSERTKLTFGDADQSWIDHSGLGPVRVLQTAYSSRMQISSQLFWNSSLTGILRMPDAAEVDDFGSRAVTVARDGRLVDAGTPVTGPLLVEEYASWALVEDARLVRRTVNAALWDATAAPRLALLLEGRYFDGLLGAESRLTVWPGPAGRRTGTIVLRLSLPAGARRAHIDLRGPGVERTVTVPERGTTTVRVPVDIREPWTLVLRAREPFFASGNRFVAALSDPPRFLARAVSYEVSAVKATV